LSNKNRRLTILKTTPGKKGGEDFGVYGFGRLRDGNKI